MSHHTVDDGQLINVAGGVGGSLSTAYPASPVASDAATPSTTGISRRVPATDAKRIRIALKMSAAAGSVVTAYRVTLFGMLPSRSAGVQGARRLLVVRDDDVFEPQARWLEILYPIAADTTAELTVVTPWAWVFAGFSEYYVAVRCDQAVGALQENDRVRVFGAHC